MSYIYPFDDFKDLWEESPLIVIDTNGFLNLYRYSTETTNKILDILNTISMNQIWIPAQVLNEYNKNRQTVVTREYSKYREVTKEIERIALIAKNDIDKQFIKYNKFRFPKVKDFGQKIHAVIESIKEESKNYKEEIKEEVKKNERMLNDDKVQEFVSKLIKEESVGNPFNLSELLEIYNEGEKRYKYKIPPGYMDIEKDKDDPTKREKFGDLVLWKQVLEHSKECDSNIIFITNDEKEDWWILDKDNNPLRPREELFDEFKYYSKKELVVMNLTNFINHVSIINNMVDHKTHIEMNAGSVCEDLIEYKGFEETLDGSSDLTSYLIHSGDLQDFIDNPLSDVEIYDFNKPEINIDSVDIDENQVIIEGTFQTTVEATITESFSKNYSRNITAPILISGSISFEFEVDFEKDEDFIDMDTLDINIGGFEVLECGTDYDEVDFEEGCINCGNPHAHYYTANGALVCDRCSDNYEVCPECGKLFDQGTLGGAFCHSCELERTN